MFECLFPRWWKFRGPIQWYLSQSSCCCHTSMAKDSLRDHIFIGEGRLVEPWPSVEPIVAFPEEKKLFNDVSKVTLFWFREWPPRIEGARHHWYKALETKGEKDHSSSHKEGQDPEDICHPLQYTDDGAEAECWQQPHLSLKYKCWLCWWVPKV